MPIQLGVRAKPLFTFKTMEVLEHSLSTQLFTKMVIFQPPGVGGAGGSPGGITHICNQIPELRRLEVSYEICMD